MALAHIACQTRHSKGDYLGDYWAILRLFLRMPFGDYLNYLTKVVII